ncbi:MAG: hypothetical protein QXU73_03080 [Thermoplasmata archaeon]
MKEYLIFFAKRVVALFIVLFLIASLFFSIFFVWPSRPSASISSSITPTLREAIEEDLKLGEPIYVQYANYMVKVFTGRFFVSQSVYRGVTTGDFIYEHLKWTLMLLATVAATLILVAGIARALSRSKAYGRLGPPFRILQIGLFAFPILILVLCILDLSARWSNLPIWGHYDCEHFGQMSSFERLIDIGKHLIIPFSALMLSALGSVPLVMNDCRRLQRASSPEGAMLATGSPVHGAAGSGRPRTELIAVLFLIPWVVFLTIPVDIVMQYHGLGTLLWHSVYDRDWQVLLASVVLISFLVAVLQFVVMVSYPFWAPVPRESRWRAEAVEEGRANPVETSEQNSTASNTQWLKEIAVAFWHKKRGVVAGAVLLAMAVTALLAPMLSPVGNPLDADNLEPSDYASGRENPLPPTLSRSAATGFTHPLGTDAYGRDVSALMLYGSGTELVRIVSLCLLCVLIAFATGLLAHFFRGLHGLVGWFVDRSLSAMAYSLLAVPVLTLAVCDLETRDSLMWIHIALWAWAPAALISREAVKTDAGSRTAHWHATVDMIAARSLFIGKYTAIMAYLSVFAYAFLNWRVYDPTKVYWNEMLGHAYVSDLFLRGAWWTFIPPLVAIIMMIGATFVFLDTLSKVFEERIATASSLNCGQGT